MWPTSRARGACLLAVFASAGVLLGTGGAAAAPPAKTTYVVVYTTGTDAAARAKQLHVDPDYVYSSALNGFSAKLTTEQLARVRQDPDLLMITDNDGNDLTNPANAAVTRGSTSTPPFGVGRAHDLPGSGPIAGGDITATTGGKGGGGPVVHIPQIPQIDSYGFDRVGGLQTPWIQMDGVDDRIDADIAVLDSGVESNNHDLRVAGGTDCLHGSGVRDFQDQNGHGTRVAGIAGMIDNKWGGIGVAPGARIWGVRVLDATLTGTESTVLCGLDWVAAHADTIEVANMSLGGPGADDGNCGLTNHDPIHLAVCSVVAEGVTLVASAGNAFSDASAFIPAAYGEVIAVSGISDSDGMPGGLGGANCAGFADDIFAPFSNWGSPIDIAAPAVCIPSTNVGDTFYRDSGTSYAAPFVTGAAAQYMVHHPAATPAQVRQAIIDAREQTAFPGDPDGIAEGLLDLANLR